MAHKVFLKMSFFVTFGVCSAKNKSGRFGADDDGRKERFRATRRG